MADALFITENAKPVSSGQIPKEYTGDDIQQDGSIRGYSLADRQSLETRSGIIVKDAASLEEAKKKILHNVRYNSRTRESVEMEFAEKDKRYADQQKANETLAEAAEMREDPSPLPEEEPEIDFDPEPTFWDKTKEFGSDVGSGITSGVTSAINGIGRGVTWAKDGFGDVAGFCAPGVNYIADGAGKSLDYLGVDSSNLGAIIAGDRSAMLGLSPHIAGNVLDSVGSIGDMEATKTMSANVTPGEIPGMTGSAESALINMPETPGNLAAAKDVVGYKLNGSLPGATLGAPRVPSAMNYVGTSGLDIPSKIDTVPQGFMPNQVMTNASQVTKLSAGSPEKLNSLGYSDKSKTLLSVGVMTAASGDRSRASGLAALGTTRTTPKHSIFDVGSKALTLGAKAIDSQDQVITGPDGKKSVIRKSDKAAMEATAGPSPEELEASRQKAIAQSAEIRKRAAAREADEAVNGKKPKPFISW